MARRRKRRLEGEPRTAAATIMSHRPRPARCAVCQRVYLAHAGNSKYCTPACRQVAYRERKAAAALEESLPLAASA